MRLSPRYVTLKNRDVESNSTNMMHPEFCRNRQCCERWGEWVHMHGAEQQRGCSVLPCLSWLSFPFALLWEAAYGGGMILEKMFNEVKDTFSCVSAWLWLTVSITGEESSHYGEAVGWEEKVGRRPASLQGDGRPSFTGRTCRTTRWTSAEDMQRQQPSLSLKLAGSA